MKIQNRGKARVSTATTLQELIGWSGKRFSAPKVSPNPYLKNKENNDEKIQ